MNKFCPDCHNLLDLKKNINLVQVEEVDKFIELLLNGTINISSNIKLDKLKSSNKYKKLSSDEHSIIIDNYEKYTNLNKFGFYYCLNCNYFKNINNGTILIDNSKVKDTNSSLFLDLQAENKILPRTRDYVCPNKNCKANNKLFKDREAVFYRIDKSYRISYLCCLCKTEWNI